MDNDVLEHVMNKISKAQTYKERLILSLTPPELNPFSITEFFFWSKFSLAMNSDS